MIGDRFNHHVAIQPCIPQLLPVQIQEKHRAKIEALRNETRQVKDYVQMLNSDSV